MNPESSSAIQNILRKAKKNNFTIIDNDMLRDSRLSWKARGLLCYLLHLPDDWKINFNHLEKQSPDGERSLRSGLKELKDLGYLSVERFKEKGKFTSCIWTVYESPNIEKNTPTTTYKPQLQNAVLENVVLQNEALLSTNPLPSTNPTNIYISFGSFVKFKEGHYDELCKAYGKEITDSIIEDINNHCVNNRPKGYPDYAAAFRTFFKRQKAQPKPGAKKSFKDLFAAQYKADTPYGGYYINFDDFSVTITTSSAYPIFNLKYTEHGFLEQFENVCRTRKIPFKRDIK